LAPWWDAPFIRDCFDGAAAARLLALVSMIFSLSPALAPVFGGWVVTLFTWRAIFLALFAYAVAMLVLCVRAACRKPCRGMHAARSESAF
jgi:MFS family permease